MNSVLLKFRPEIAAGGFARDDGLVAFYQRINALVRPDMTVVDLGCGRGAVFDGDQGLRSAIAKLQGRVEKIIGIDVDEAVSQHPFLDERFLISPGDRLPVQDGSVDLVVSDWVLEHIADVDAFTAELHRVLKPNGWFCARTPNKWGYGGLATRMVPNWLHTKVVSRAMPTRPEEDVFPTHYNLNSLASVQHAFCPPRWRNCSYTETTTPKYFGNSALLFRLIDIYQSIVPANLRTNLMVFVQKVS